MAHELDTRRRRELRRQGLCISCATAKATPNKDGNMGLRCDPCGKAYSGQSGSIKKSRSESPKTSAANVVKKPTSRPSVIYDADGDPYLYLDSRAFAEYAVKVARSIKRLKRASIAELRRDMGETFDERNIFNAIDRLVGAGEIEQVSFGDLKRWSIARQPARQVQTEWNRNQHMLPSKPQQPYNESQFRGRNVTA